MLRKISRSVADMNSGEKVLLTGAIYFILLGVGTVSFQHIEEEAMLERCERYFHKTFATLKTHI